MRSIKSKIYKREDLATIIASLKKEGKKVGFTNGVFDILHAGHVVYLEKAKEICDVLIVSLNTDASVKEYKGDMRPIVPEQKRAEVVAALESVNYVTFHPERRMRTTLEILKPDYYIKGGDYDAKSLTSSDVLVKWGGEVRFIPLVEGISTTNIINKIIATYQTVKIENHGTVTPKKVVILDRDGVINEEIEYLHEPEKFKFIPGVIGALQKLQENGYALVIATVQAGIGLGYFTEEDFYKVNRYMLRELSQNGITISKIYFCPHSISENCNCRKPKTGMFEQAAKDLQVNLSDCWVVGDKSSDVIAGKSVGCHTILVETGHAGRDAETSTKPDFIAKDLAKATDIILSTH